MYNNFLVGCEVETRQRMLTVGGVASERNQGQRWRLMRNVPMSESRNDSGDQETTRRLQYARSSLLEINDTSAPFISLSPSHLPLPPSSPFPNSLYATTLEGCEMNRHERSRSRDRYAAWRRRMFAEHELTTQEVERLARSPRSLRGVRSWIRRVRFGE